MAPDRAGQQSANRPHRTPGGPPGETALDRARSHLRKADPVLARIIDARPTFDPQGWMAELPAMDLFGALLFQVTGQQLSVAATRRTLGRIETLFGGHLPSPADLLEVPPGQSPPGWSVLAQGGHPARPGRALRRRSIGPRQL